MNANFSRKFSLSAIASFAIVGTSVLAGVVSPLHTFAAPLAKGNSQPAVPPALVSASAPPLDLRHTLPDGAVLSLSFSPDGQTLATTPTFLELWDVKTGKLKRTLEHKDYPLASRASFSPTASLVAVLLGNDKTNQDALVLWNTQSGQIIRKLERPKTNRSWWQGFAFSPDGKLLATVQGDEQTPTTLLIWNVETGEITKTVSEVDNKTIQLAFLAQWQNFGRSFRQSPPIVGCADGQVAASFGPLRSHILCLCARWRGAGQH